MAIEIESKAWLEDPDAVQARLEADPEGFSFEGLAVRDDQYLVEEGVTLNTMDPTRHRLVRIRRSSDGASDLGPNAMVTVKERHLEAGTEINRETEVTVDDAESANTLLQYLGYTPLIRKTKRMRIYRRGQVTVEISHIDGLGAFIECERVLEEAASPEARQQAVEAVAEAMEAAGVAANRVEPRPYLDMLRERLSKSPAP